MDPELDKRLVTLEAKLDATYVKAKKTYTIMLWTSLIQLAFFVLPIIGIALLAPTLLSTMTGQVSGLQGL
jgi:hypothetical protein